MLKPFLHENTGAYQISALDEFIDRMKGNGIRFLTMQSLTAIW